MDGYSLSFTQTDGFSSVIKKTVLSPFSSQKAIDDQIGGINLHDEGNDCSQHKCQYDIFYLDDFCYDILGINEVCCCYSDNKYYNKSGL